MAFHYYFKFRFQDGRVVDLHSEGPNKAIADLQKMGHSTAAIARIEAKESGKDGNWSVIYPKVK